MKMLQTGFYISCIDKGYVELLIRKFQISIKVATKLYEIFGSFTKISENKTNNLNCFFSKLIYTLVHQIKYIHADKKKYFL